MEGGGLLPETTRDSQQLFPPRSLTQVLGPATLFACSQGVRVKTEAFIDMWCLCGCCGLESYAGSLQVEEFLRECFYLVVVSLGLVSWALIHGWFILTASKGALGPSWVVSLCLTRLSQ